MSNREALVQELSKAVKDTAAASTAAELGAVYKDIVGYDLYEDDPSQSVEELRSACNDMVREICYQSEIHVSEVGL